MVKQMATAPGGSPADREIMSTHYEKLTITGPRFWVNTNTQRGGWERKDGTEGGELLFDRLASGALELFDFDGAACLPLVICRGLRAAGVVVSDDFNTATYL